MSKLEADVMLLEFKSTTGLSTKEAIEFCTYYLDIKRVGVLESRHEGRLRGKGTVGEKSITVDDLVSFRQAQFAVL